MGSKRKRNKKKWKRFIAFIMFELIFTIITQWDC